MEKEPKVSVIMPIYNAEKFIAKAIESILNQTYHNLELILIDDCPTDRTLEIIGQYKDDRICLVHNKKNLGIAYSRNKGLSLCNGKYVALMDDDDIAIKDRLKMQVEYLENNSCIDVLGGKIKSIDENGVIIGNSGIALMNPLYIRAMLMFKNVMFNGTVMLRKSFVDKYGLEYENNCLGMEDFKLWIESSKVGNLSNLDEVLLLYRRTENSETSKVKENNLNQRKKLYAQFQRYSLIRSGFSLDENEIMVLNKVQTETNPKCESREELTRFYFVLKKIITQAKGMNLDNQKEIESACKKLFADKIYRSECVWL